MIIFFKQCRHKMKEHVNATFQIMPAIEFLSMSVNDL